MEEEEYELVPLSPIRRMEKRLERIEKTSTSDQMVRELIDVVKMNQQIVDDIVKINSELINKITDLSVSVNKSITKMDEFMSRIEVAEEAEGSQESAAPTLNKADERLDKLEKRINTLLLTTVAKSKFGQKMQAKRPALP